LFLSPIGSLIVVICLVAVVRWIARGFAVERALPRNRFLIGLFGLTLLVEPRRDEATTVRSLTYLRG
jgi:hypothetical protein